MVQVNRAQGAGDSNSDSIKLQEYNNLKKKHNLTQQEHTRMKQLENELIKKGIIAPFSGETIKDPRYDSPLQGISLYSFDVKQGLGEIANNIQNKFGSIFNNQ